MIPVKNNTADKIRRFRAEIWDQLQYFFQEYNDHQLHGVINFKGQLDWESIKKAVISSMDTVPLLKSHFVLNHCRPYRQSLSHYEEHEVISLTHASNPEEEVSNFLTGITNELTGPQLRVKIVRSPCQDTLCIVMNHMVCDGKRAAGICNLSSMILCNKC